MTGTTGRTSLAAEGRGLVEELGGRWSGNGGVCRCPAHDDRTPSLSVRPGSSRLLFHCFAGCDTASVLRALAKAGLTRRVPVPAAGAQGDGDGGACLAAAAIRLWGAAQPLGGTPAELYLAARCLAPNSGDLRYHWRTPLGARPFTRFRPALIAAVRGEAGIVAVHRTFLDPRRQGVAAAGNRKCALGPLGRGAVRLGGVAPKLGLAEGIETALSASALFDVPCWATLGTERFRHVALPEEVTELLLFLDNDEGGRRAEALAREANGHIPSIEAHYPRRRGDDWNDVLGARELAHRQR